MKKKHEEKIINLMNKLILGHGDKVIFTGWIYPEHTSKLFYWVENGENKYYGFEKKPDEVEEMMNVLEQCLNYEHFLITAYKSGEVDIQTRYIPEEDTWPRLIMKKVSELTEEEWQETNIPKADWEERKALVALPDSERIPIILGRDLQARLNNRKLITLEVELENTPIVKVTILSEDGTEKVLDLPEVSVDWFIKQSTELRASPPYQKTPWAKMIMTVDKTGKFKTNFEYDD